MQLLGECFDGHGAGGKFGQGCSAKLGPGTAGRCGRCGQLADTLDVCARVHGALTPVIDN